MSQRAQKRRGCDARARHQGRNRPAGRLMRCRCPGAPPTVCICRASIRSHILVAPPSVAAPGLSPVFSLPSPAPGGAIVSLRSTTAGRKVRSSCQSRSSPPLPLQPPPLPPAAACRLLLTCSSVAPASLSAARRSRMTCDAAGIWWQTLGNGSRGGSQLVRPFHHWQLPASLHLYSRCRQPAAAALAEKGSGTCAHSRPSAPLPPAQHTPRAPAAPWPPAWRRAAAAGGPLLSGRLQDSAAKLDSCPER